jgi:hypothetical protein
MDQCHSTALRQGCQMACFTIEPKMGKFWRDLQRKMLVYFMAIWYILWPFGIYCYGHLVYFVAIWYTSWLFGIFSCFGMLHQEKSGNPAL